MKHILIYLLIPACIAIAATADAQSPTYRSPCQSAWLDAKTIVVSDATFGRAYIADAATGKLTHEVKLNGKPAGVAVAGDVFYVAETGAGTVAGIGADGVLKRRFNVGPRPMGLVVAEKSKRLIVADNGPGHVDVVDIGSGTLLGKIAVTGLPYAVAVAPDEKTAATVSELPVGDARCDDHAAALTLIDLETMTKRGDDVKLLPGTGHVTGLAASMDGKWLYIVHTLARFMLPTTQIDRGWINSNALTIIDLTGHQRYATVSLDNLSQGAADPWGIALAHDGSTAWITLAGTHELMHVDLTELHSLLARLTLEQRSALSDDLAVMAASKILTRISLPGFGPRGVAVSPDGATVAAALYFSGRVALLDVQKSTVSSIALGGQPVESEARKGERLFHDATLSHQHWLSCATCHPDTRADGFNWDLLNDGIGNPKNTKSMVLSAQTPPMMWTGVRENLPHAVQAGFRFILFREPEPDEAEAVTTYLESLSPVPSPYLVNGKRSEKAKHGKAVFQRANCAVCHPAPLFTDLKSYDVGTRHELDHGDGDKQFVTPTLVELWRTAPYLHDGSAATLKEVLTTYNLKNRHAMTSKLSQDEVEDLVEYLLSL